MRVSGILPETYRDINVSSIDGIAFEWLFSRLFALGPKLTKEGNVLVARSNWKSQLLCLGFAGRTVRVDPRLKTIHVELRKGWGFKSSRRIEFEWVEEILYGYQDMSGGWGAHQEEDMFTVGLRLKNGEEVNLFRFVGTGGFANDSVWPDWMYWDDYLVSPYIQGNQESESLMFADLLSRMIGVPIGNPGL